MDHDVALLELLGKGSPAELRIGKYAMRALESMSFDAALAFAEPQIGLGAQTNDAREGLAAFGAREARWLIKDHDVPGFKFHPTLQGFFANDRTAYPIYEVIAEHSLPAIFHTGHSGIGSGMKGGGGLKLKYSEPIYLDDVATDFPDMKIIAAHPSWPWQEQALSIALHKPNV